MEGAREDDQSWTSSAGPQWVVERTRGDFSATGGYAVGGGVIWRSAILTSPHPGLWVGEDNLAPYYKWMPSTNQKKLFTQSGMVQSSSNR